MRSATMQFGALALALSSLVAAFDFEAGSILASRQENNKTVAITSEQWKSCRQSVPCASNTKIKTKYDVDACVAVAKRWNTTDKEDIEPYVAIGPYDVNDQTNCQVYVSNLGANQITISREDMVGAITNLSKLCFDKSPEHNSVICDIDYNGGSAHIEILAKSEKDMIAPVTQTGTAKSGASASGSVTGSASGGGSATGSATGSASSGGSASGGQANSKQNTPASGSPSSGGSTPSPSPSSGGSSPSATPSPSPSAAPATRVKRSFVQLF